MSTLLARGTRRCNARCHYSPADTCGCVCEGRLHGVGNAAEERLVGLLTSGKLPGVLRVGALHWLPDNSLDVPLPGIREERRHGKPG